MKYQFDYQFNYDDFLAVLIGMGIILPVFFQIEGGIFRDTAMVFDSQGLIKKLPIPLSALVCVLGTFLLIVRHRKMFLALGLIFLYIIYILLLVVIRGQYDNICNNIILLLQFTLPICVLVLGLLYATIDNKLFILPKVFMFVIWLIVPAQLYCSLLESIASVGGKPSTLFPSLYIFSIYQHLQYVPVIFASGFLFIMYSLANDGRLGKWVGIFAPIMAFYLFVSSSIVSIALFLFAIASWMFLYSPGIKGERCIKIIALVMLSLIVLSGYMYVFRDYNMLKEKLTLLPGRDLRNIRIKGIVQRSIYWEYYGRGATRDVKSFLMGNAKVAARRDNPSAHNYYLDFLYHFGFLSLMPFLVFIGATLYGIYRRRRDIIASPQLMGITIVFLYLVFIENMFKVGMREPYPGIFTFFLWGILISKLFLERHFDNNNLSASFQ